MAFGKKSGFANYIAKGAFFEAYIEYMSDEDACEAELVTLKSGRNAAAAADFAQYAGVWNAFRDHTLRGDYDLAAQTVGNNPYGDEMGVPEIKSVLDDLAEKTGSFHCYAVYWRLCGEQTVAAHEYALDMLTQHIPDDNRGKEAASDHLFWLVNNTQKKERLRFAELGLEHYLKPDSYLSDMDASALITIAREINPQSKGAVKTEYTLYERDRAALAAVRPLVQSGAYDEAIDSLADGDSFEVARRVLLRGANENKPDAAAFAEALQTLYERTNDPSDAFYAASAIWHSDVRKDEEKLARSMALSLWALDHLPHRNRYAVALLDALYLIEPYPLANDVAVKIAKSVLEENPENEIALECIAIAREQGANVE
jgi:hypothetical protein